MSQASSLSSQKSYGCDWISTRRPSRSMIGSNSSMERNHMPLQISCWFGSPESSVLMTGTPMLTAISIIFFQLATAILRCSSVGPDQR